MSLLEIVNQAKHGTARPAAAECACAASRCAFLTHGDRVAVDVERVRSFALVLQLDVTRVQHGARRQAVAVGHFILLNTGIVALDYIADALAPGGAALAVAGLAVEHIELAAAGRDGARNAPEIATQIAGRCVVAGALVHAGDAQAEALHDRAEVVRTD